MTAQAAGAVWAVCVQILLSAQKRYGKIMAVGKDCLAMKYKDQYGSERCIRKGVSCRLGRRPDKGRKAEENVCNS